jgi:hypothetical protein
MQRPPALVSPRGRPPCRKFAPFVGFGMLGILVAIVALAYLYASLSRPGGGLGAGLQFGAVIGVFVLGAFVLHNYVNLNIGWRLTLAQGVAYFVEWSLVGAVIGLIYRPLGA